MERRRESRIPALAFTRDTSARIQPLGNNDPAFDATLVDISGHGMRFSAGSPVALDTAVKIEIGDALVLGEIMHCTPSGSGFVLGVKADQVLSSLVGLLRLQHVLIEEQTPRPLAVSTAKK